MATRSISQLKAWFKKGMYPTESQFGDWLDSFLHRNDKIPVGSVDGLSEAVNGKAEQSEVDMLSQNISGLSAQVTAADEKAQQAIEEAGSVISTLRDGVAPTGDTLAKLYGLIQTINEVLHTDDVTLDTVQEIVAFIKSNKTAIDTLSTTKVNIGDIVDNLLSTAANKPLSAHQGRVLKELLDALTTSLGSKVDIVNGKQLSTEDFTTAEKGKLAQQSGVNTGDQDLSGLQAKSEKNQANGYAGLDGVGKIPATLLPSYVDDVLEFASFVALPATGESGKIYITSNDNKQYRWSGSAYVNIATSPGTTDAVTEGATNLYFTEGRVRNTLLTGISFLVNQAITATDSVLGALGKLQAQITALGNSKVDKNGTDTLMTAAERTKLTGIAEGANNYVHPTLHPASMVALAQNKTLVGNSQGVGEETDAIPIFNQSLTYEGQMYANPLFFLVNAGGGNTSNLKSIAKSAQFNNLNNQIIKLFAPVANANFIVHRACLIYQGFSGSGTVETTPSTITLSTNVDGSAPFANLNYSRKYEGKTDGTISNDYISLSNGLYVNIANRVGGTDFCKMVVLIEGAYV